VTCDRSNRYSRRALLKGLGLGLGLLPLLDSEPVVAGSAGKVKRFISVTWTNGIVPENFYPEVGPLISPLPAILAPLEPWKSKLLALRGTGPGPGSGIDSQVMLDLNLLYSGHAAYPSLLTGSYVRGGFGGGSASTGSIDSLISDALKLQGLRTPQLNVGARPFASSTSWSASGQINRPETDPNRLYTRLFGGSAQLLARRQSVLDFCIDDLTRFGARVGREDKLKIDAHLASIRTLETELAGLPGCQPPATPTGVTFTQLANYPLLVKSMMDLVAAAVKCDFARAITIDLIDDGGGNSLTFPWLNIPSPDYSAIAHQGPAGYAQKSQIDTWFYSQVAGLVEQLAGTAESGSSSLDNTVILVCNDMNDGWNEMVKDLPYLIIGSGGGFFKQGTCVQFASNLPNNLLLTSVCHALGLNVASVGTTYPGDLDATLGA
jgi:hypothetical protein